jgi:tRNA pseudouridine13 synthase
MTPCPYGAPSLRGVFKSRCEDFVVVEELGFEPDGQGEHRFLFVEKSGLTTPELVDRLARHYRIKSRDIGYSGLKDRQALTRQWLSLPAAACEGSPPASEDFRILEQTRHGRKLKRGNHRTNYFEVRLRDVEQFTDRAREQIEQIVQNGYANYFGEQRFGRRGDNVEQALRKLSASRLPRWRRGLLLSALRSHLFNQILARRVELDLWREPLDGDVFMLRGSHSIFSAPVDDEIRQRFAALDIASTASLYGSGPCQLSGSAQEIEEAVLADNPEIVRCLDRQPVKRQMRALRVAVEDLEYRYDAERRTLELSLRLPAGCYLTSLLDHFAERDSPV